MARYEIITGKFPCHTCDDVPTSLRMYSETKELTWMCKNKHLTTVSLRIERRSKKDYEREG